MFARRRYRFSTARQEGLIGHSDEDHAAICWKEGWTLLTLDFDFLDPERVPHHRNPGIVVLDCNGQREAEITSAVATFVAFEQRVARVVRGMWVIARSDAVVHVWSTQTPRRRPNAIYKVDVADR